MAVINPELERLAGARYLSLTTFGPDGTPVAGPVRVVSEGGYLQVIADASSGEVERVHQTSRVTVGPCDLRGRLQGDPVAANAAVVDDPVLVDRVTHLVVQRYGFLARVLTWVQALRRRTYVALAIDVPLPGEVTD